MFHCDWGYLSIYRIVGHAIHLMGKITETTPVNPVVQCLMCTLVHHAQKQNMQHCFVFVLTNIDHKACVILRPSTGTKAANVCVI